RKARAAGAVAPSAVAHLLVRHGARGEGTVRRIPASQDQYRPRPAEGAGPPAVCRCARVRDQRRAPAHGRAARPPDRKRAPRIAMGPPAARKPRETVARRDRPRKARLGGAVEAFPARGRLNPGRTRRTAALTGLVLVLALALAPATAQAQRKVPWAAGENLEYTVKLSGIRAGTGVMQVVSVDTIRGRTAWRLHFNIKGSVFGLYHVDDTYDSWMDVKSLNSLRFEQNLLDGGKHTVRKYDIFPGRGIFHQEGKEERKSVADPLDDASFFFFERC